MCGNSWNAAAITRDPFGACNRLVAAVTPAADDPYFHPYLYGSRLRRRRCAPASTASPAGIGEGHMLRALFEGVAFEHRRHVDVLRAAGVRFDSASLSGGGARSEVWPQMFADILGIPVSVAAPARRPARSAPRSPPAVGAGLFSGLPEAVRAMTASGRGSRPTRAWRRSTMNATVPMACSPRR